MTGAEKISNFQKESKQALKEECCLWTKFLRTQ